MENLLINYYIKGWTLLSILKLFISSIHNTHTPYSTALGLGRPARLNQLFNSLYVSYTTCNHYFPTSGSGNLLPDCSPWPSLRMWQGDSIPQPKPGLFRDRHVVPGGMVLETSTLTTFLTGSTGRDGGSN